MESKTFSFGKFAYANPKRKANEITVTVTIYNGNTLSVVGDIWNAKKTDVVRCGQCLDTIAEYVKCRKFKEIYNLWNEYHLKVMPSDVLAKVREIIHE